MPTHFRVAFAIAAVAMLAARTSVNGFSSSSPPPIPPPPLISMPVWSFATASMTKTSMNIMTFCTPVSVSSPKLWTLSFYHGTLTKDSFLGRSCIQEGKDFTIGDLQNSFSIKKRRGLSVGVLQLLKFDHRYLVPILGKQSGRDIDKSILCCEKGFSWLRISNSNRGDSNEDASASADREIDTDTDTDTDSSDRERAQDRDFELLPGCALYLQVECQSSTSLIDVGDHVVAIFEVTRIGVWEQKGGEELDGGKVRWLDQTIDGNSISHSLGGIDESDALYSGRLREEGIL